MINCPHLSLKNLGRFCTLLQIHGSANGKNFRSKLRAEHIELLQSPWLIELGAFYMNCRGSNAERNKGSSQFLFDFDPERPVMTMSLPDSMMVEYDLTCAICLVFTIPLSARGRSFCFSYITFTLRSPFHISCLCCFYHFPGYRVQPIRLELRTSVLQVVCLLRCFCAHLPRTESCKCR